MRMLLKILLGLSWAWLVTGAGIIVAQPAFLNPATLPKIDGTTLVEGVTQPVEIVRDRYGIPHIYAQSNSDAYFGLGFVHAQDRLWQMEFNRRLAAGRLSEILGKPTLGTDMFFRTISLRYYAQRAFEYLDADIQALLKSYTAGVNAYLKARKGPLAPEFLILKHRPEPWAEADSIAWLKVMGWSLGDYWGDELLRAGLGAMLTPEQVADLFPPRPGVVPRGIVMPKFAVLYRRLPVDALLKLADASRSNGAASNNWVVGSSRSATGKPLLANDPHLSLGAPSLWYLVHMETPDGSLIGGTMPGMPVVAIGRNESAAWGLTNVMADAQDTYIERLDSADSGKYMTPNGPQAFEIRKEIVKVKGGKDVPLNIRSTRHGIVLSDIAPPAAKVAGEGNVLAVAWTGWQDKDPTIQGFFRMSMAKKVTDFPAALRDIQTLLLNVVYADVEGNIGYHTTGKIPLRKRGVPAERILPSPGWKAAYDWQGFIPFDKLPHTFNPSSGVIATANHNIVSDDYPYYISSNWVPGYRIRRIRELLGAREKHSLQSFGQIQGDVKSVMATELLPFVQDVTVSNPETVKARNLLRGWNAVMERDLPEPLIFITWLNEFTQLVAADELGPLYGGYAKGKKGVRRTVRFLRHALIARQSWCDNVGTDAKKESCADLSATALAQAVKKLSETYGPNPQNWRWGKAHPSLHKHNPFGANPKLRDIFNLSVDGAGGPFTVNVASFKPAEKPVFTQTHGPGLRILVDLSNPDQSLFIQTTGQSGNPASDLYRSFVERWRDIEYVPMTTRRKEIEEGRLGVLHLRPQ